MIPPHVLRRYHQLTRLLRRRRPDVPLPPRADDALGQGNTNRQLLALLQGGRATQAARARDPFVIPEKIRGKG